MIITLDPSRAWWRVRRWCWLRLFFHFDPVAAAVAPWVRRHARCMGCGVKLDADELTYYGHACERCEGHNSRAFDT